MGQVKSFGLVGIRNSLNQVILAHVNSLSTAARISKLILENSLWRLSEFVWNFKDLVMLVFPVTPERDEEFVG